MKYYKVNEKIKAPKVRVIKEKGDHLGVMETKEALQKAKEADLDLVEISPKAKPPVAKITNFGEFKYKLKKKAKQQNKKTKKSTIKGIRLSFTIGEHDIQTKEKKATKFLKNGDKVKIELMLRGREKAKGKEAKQVIRNFIKRLDDIAEIENPPSRQGHKITSLINPK
ncbi:MAG TPA: translation initiation factor IF-3 [Patescibacteria group bacterium]|nr:translation initiation factor IF-3 [Patescibacteria group bacterium]